MIEEGLRVMAVGMTTVFAFLALLVLLMQLSGRLLKDRFADAAVAPASSAPVAAGGDDDPRAIAVAIAAAADAARRGHPR